MTSFKNNIETWLVNTSIATLVINSNRVTGHTGLSIQNYGFRSVSLWVRLSV